jgi:spermidine synthase
MDLSREMADREAPVVLDRVAGRHGELVLRGDGADYEVISNGVFLMDTRDGRSERLLVAAVLDGLRAGASLLIGGLGVGYSLAEALRSDAVGHVTVVEIEPAVIAWNRGPLASVSGRALADPRVAVVGADLVDWLALTHGQFDAICLDVDNGPAWTVSESNGALYTDQGLELLRGRLAPGGALTIWSASRVEAFEASLRRAFARVETLTVEVPRGEPDVVYAAWRD